MTKKIGIVSREDRKKTLQLVDKLVNQLENNGILIMLDPRLIKHVNRPAFAMTLEKMRADLVLTIGGNGTILRTCLQEGRGAESNCC